MRRLEPPGALAAFSAAACLVADGVGWLLAATASGSACPAAGRCAPLYAHFALALALMGLAARTNTASGWLAVLYFTAAGVDLLWSASWVFVVIVPTVLTPSSGRTRWLPAAALCTIAALECIASAFHYIAADDPSAAAAAAGLPYGLLTRAAPCLAVALQLAFLLRHPEQLMMRDSIVPVTSPSPSVVYASQSLSWDLTKGPDTVDRRTFVYELPGDPLLALPSLPDPSPSSPTLRFDLSPNSGACKKKPGAPSPAMSALLYNTAADLPGDLPHTVADPEAGAIERRSAVAEAEEASIAAHVETSSCSSGLGMDSEADAIDEDDGNTERHEKYLMLRSVFARGGFAEVYLAMHVKTGQIIAVKRLAVGFTQEQARALAHEVDILKGLNHPNIVQYLGTDDSDDQVSIFMEYVPAGSLAALLAETGPLAESVLRIYLGQILNGLQYLHVKGITHRDIKAQNILLSRCWQSMVLKLADFGCSWKGRQEPGAPPLIGTVLWMAPEVARQQCCGPSSDIWSLGCTVVEMATARPPWGDRFDNPLAALFHIAACAEGPPVPRHLSPQARAFVRRCLDPDHARRPSCVELWANAWLAPTPAFPTRPSVIWRKHRAGSTLSCSMDGGSTDVALDMERLQRSPRVGPQTAPRRVSLIAAAAAAGPASRPPPSPNAPWRPPSQASFTAPFDLLRYSFGCDTTAAPHSTAGGGGSGGGGPSQRPPSGADASCLRTESVGRIVVVPSPARTR